MNTTPPPTTWLTLKEAASRLGYSYRHTRRLVKAGDIKKCQRAPGCDIHIAVQEVNRLLSEK